MVDYVPSEKATPVRMPSVANLMIDALNRRVGDSPGKFTIQKNASILNGFFTRLGVTEVVLEWGVPNITAGYENNQFTVDVSGVEITVTAPDGNYNVAQILNNLTEALNDGQNNHIFDLSGTPGSVYLNCKSGGVDQPYEIKQEYLADQLGFIQNTLGNNFGPGEANTVDLRWWRYLDFISTDLTYPQDVKDGSTNQNERNVLCRFYLSWDNPPQNDIYGFPILVGYQFCTLRRIFSPPKQIKWEPNLPVGNLSFEVFGATGPVMYPALQDYVPVVQGDLLNAQQANLDWNWMMTIQASEI
jgi:hypothetical protein